jgi:predicted lipoprotein
MYYSGNIMNRRLNSLRLLITMAAVLSIVACSESTSSKAGDDFGDQTPVTPTPPTTTFDQTALLTNIVDNIITPTYQNFLVEAKTQQQSINSYCSLEKSYNVGDDRQPIDAALTNSQSQWLTTMNQWQLAEVMQIGPLTVNSSTLRNNIYSWPIVSSCGVDQDVMFYKSGSINTTPYDITQRTATRRGLDAVQYLIYNPSLEHSCTSEKTILATWPTLSDEEKRVVRCEFATAVAVDIQNSAQTLNEQWATYATTLKNAGQSGNEFANVHDGVNAVSDALFYLDKMVKDTKIGTPLGLFSNDCGGVGSVCVVNVESPLSQQSISHLISNLTAFKQLFTGQGTDTSNTIGFDDYLTDVDDKATSDSIIANTQKVIDDLTAYQVTLSTRLTNDSDAVEATHIKVKAVSDQLKVDFINSLALKLPTTSAGDND